jgi:hypothetical protein
MPPTSNPPPSGSNGGKHRQPAARPGVIKLPVKVVIRIPGKRPIPALIAPAPGEAHGLPSVILKPRPAPDSDSQEQLHAIRAQLRAQFAAQLKAQLRSHSREHAAARERARDRAIAHALAAALSEKAPAGQAHASDPTAGQPHARQSSPARPDVNGPAPDVNESAPSVNEANPGGRHRAEDASRARTREPERYYGKHTQQSQGKHHRRVASAPAS